MKKLLIVILVVVVIWFIMQVSKFATKITEPKQRLDQDIELMDTQVKTNTWTY